MGEVEAAEAKLIGDRLLGRMLSTMPKAKGKLKQGADFPQSHDATTATYTDLGIQKDKAARWQQLAALPERKAWTATPQPGHTVPMRYHLEHTVPWRPGWCIRQAHKELSLSITVEVRLDFLEDPSRRNFDRVGEAEAAQLHELYREWQHEKRHV